MLGQRDVASNSEDAPAAYHYRLQYSLDQIKTAETADRPDRPGFFRTRVTASATVGVTNITHTTKLP
jgi:hypothetical protein